MRLIVITLCMLLFAQFMVAATLRVEVVDVEHNKGAVLLSLFDNEEGFPVEPDSAWREAMSGIEDGQAAFVFEDVPAGEYAISIMHDENGNNHIDSNFLGVPQEGWGASNNPRARFGPPKWKDCRFMLGDEDLTVTIKMRY